MEQDSGDLGISGETSFLVDAASVALLTSTAPFSRGALSLSRPVPAGSVSI